MKAFLYGILVKISAIYQLFSKNRLRVLAYHTVPDPKQFEKQVAFLNSEFNILSLPQLDKILSTKGKVPDNSLLITFDDGDVSVLNNALPILEKYHVPAVLFIVTRLIDSTESFWPRWVEKNFEKEGKSYFEARKKVNQLKNMPNAQRIQYLERMTQVNSPQLQREDLKFLQQNEIFIGNHTHSHPMMDKCSEDEIKEELDQVQEKFKEWSLPGYPFFAYPNGNWNIRTEKILLESGIRMAFLFDHKLATLPLNPLRISRIRVNADSEMNEFRVKVSGFHTILMKFKKYFNL